MNITKQQAAELNYEHDMRGPASLSAAIPSREWYEPPDDSRACDDCHCEIEDDKECECECRCHSRPDPSDVAYENERDKRMEVAEERRQAGRGR